MSTLSPTLEEQTSETYSAVNSSDIPLHAINPPSEQPDKTHHYSSTQPQGTPKSNENITAKLLTWKYETRFNIGRSPRRNPNRIRHLAQYSSSSSLPENVASEHERLCQSVAASHSPNAALFGARPQNIQHTAVYRTTAYGPDAPFCTTYSRLSTFLHINGCYFRRSTKHAHRNPYRSIKQGVSSRRPCFSRCACSSVAIRARRE